MVCLTTRVELKISDSANQKKKQRQGHGLLEPI